MQIPTIKISGDGLQVANTDGHPPGILFSGGYDADGQVLYLSSVMGHPRGVSLAGGDPSSDHVSGMRVLILDCGNIYWSTDSMSLPRGLAPPEAESVQRALENHFTGQPIRRVEKPEDIPR